MNLNDLNVNDLNFLESLDRFGPKRLIICWETFIAFLGVLFLLIMFLIYPGKLEGFPKGYIQQLLALSGIVFAIEITGFSISLMVMDSKFIGLLWRKGVLSNLLFPFWWVAAAWIATLLTELVALILIQLHILIMVRILVVISTFLIIYSLAATLYLVGLVFKLTMLRAYYWEIDNTHIESNNT